MGGQWESFFGCLGPEGMGACVRFFVQFDRVVVVTGFSLVEDKRRGERKRMNQSPDWENYHNDHESKR